MKDNAAVYFREEMAVESPNEHTLEELEAMSIEMNLSTIEAGEFLRQDLQSMPHQM